MRRKVIHDLHFINFRLESLHFANDCSSFRVLDPSSNICVQAIVTAELCKTNAWTKKIIKMKCCKKERLWAWYLVHVHTLQNHIALINLRPLPFPFVLSVDLEFTWKVLSRSTLDSYVTVWSTLKLQLNARSMKAKLYSKLAFFSVYLVLHFHSRKKKNFSPSRLFRDIFRLNFPIRLTLIDTMSLNITNLFVFVKTVMMMMMLSKPDTSVGKQIFNLKWNSKNFLCSSVVVSRKFFF